MDLTIAQAKEILLAELPNLDAAASPTKSEVYTACGPNARRIHDAILVVCSAATDDGVIIDKETLLDTMGTFTWFFGQDWFVETVHGNYHWSDPDYGTGDNTFTLYKGTYEQFKLKMGTFGRDGGKRIVRNKCGEDITIVIPKY
jgi:hypothetical protein